jgi:hypothetical protein
MSKSNVLQDIRLPWQTGYRSDSTIDSRGASRFFEGEFREKKRPGFWPGLYEEKGLMRD